MDSRPPQGYSAGLILSWNIHWRELGENWERLAGMMVEGGRGTPSLVGSRVRPWLRGGGGEGGM